MNHENKMWNCRYTTGKKMILISFHASGLQKFSFWKWQWKKEFNYIMMFVYTKFGLQLSILTSFQFKRCNERK